MPRYLVELYVSRLAAGGLDRAAARARTAAAEVSRLGTPVRYLRSIFVPGDETWFLLYDGPSATAVEDAVALAALPCERVVEAVTRRLHGTARRTVEGSVVKIKVRF
jgi:hypothetical protein